MYISRHSRRRIALSLCLLIVLETVFPAVAMALTSGPVQPEFEGFQQVSASNLVDPFTGDFSYNIPVCEIGGYPLNLSYASGPGVEEEASWVGLGWTLSPGSVNRTVRGLPDDFKGDEVRREITMRPDTTIGFGYGASVQVFGFLGLGVKSGSFFNNYKGWGTETGFSASATISSKQAGPNTKSLSLGGNLLYNSQSGVNLGVSVGIVSEADAQRYRSFNLGINGYNSRQGLKELGWGFSITKRVGKDKEKREGATSFSGGSISFASMGYTPVPTLPFFNKSFSYHGSVGGEIVGVHPNLLINGYFVEQFLANKDIRRPAYGTLYHQYASAEGAGNVDDVLLDFNKDQHKPYQKVAPAVSPVVGTFDLFQVSAHGLGGQFRLHRNDVGYFHEPMNKSRSSAESIGGELGVGNAFHAGVDINVTDSETRQGSWNKENDAAAKFAFTRQETAHDVPAGWNYEPAYFRMSGELHMSDTALSDRLYRDKPSRIRMDRYGPYTARASGAVISEANLRAADEKPITALVSNTSTERQVRNTDISYLTHEQMEMQGRNPSIHAFPFNTFPNSGCIPDTLASRASRLSYPGHHLSEITMTDNGGQVFQFGLPVYNRVQQDVVLSIQNPVSPPADGIATYTTGTTGDNTVHNKRGRDWYFNRETLPAYATSFLVTGIYSADYVDRTGDGVTADDLGNAIRFRYSVTSGHRWRNPVHTIAGRARYNAGYRSDPGDDKASYVYGERDNWYLHSMESPTEVARFYTSVRTDGLGVVNQEGVKDNTQTLRKLDSIVVFSRSDLERFGSAAVPQKTVVFEYETSTANSLNLAKGIPNTSNSNYGKLVLKGVYTKYKLNQTKYNYYTFLYHTSYVQSGTKYYNYTYNSTDRWGNFRVHDLLQYPYALDFPYVYQDPAHATISANAFNLRQITLPSGGVITVEYESDDYAFVQDKRAGQMMTIKGFTAAGNNTLVNTLYSSASVQHPYIVLDLPLPVPLAQVRERYFQHVEQIYFNCWVDMDGKGSSEYVSGYLNYDINDIQAFSTNGGGEATAIKIRLLPLDTDTNEKIHPITKAATQMLRLELQHLFTPQISAASPGAVIRNSISFFDDIGIMFSGFDKFAVSRGYGKTVTVARSWIRLANPTFKKFGGGARVKTLQLSDNWGSMTTGTTTTNHIQDFFYETDHIVNGAKQKISSGVASWEPALGGNENLHRTPLPYKEEIKLAPDNYYYMEKPLGESLYPAPSVGYSEVKVRNRTARANNSSNGYTLYKFYTARDFPAISYMTAKNRVSLRPDAILRFFGFSHTDLEHVSQGFVVETNDMHGKPKEEAEYNETGDLLTSTRYEYKTVAGDDGRQRLDNRVQVLHKNGTKVGGTLGLVIDTWADFSEEENRSKTLGLSVNTDGFFAFLPFIIPMLIPIYQQSHTRLRTAVLTKKVHRQGILSKTIRMHYGATLATENLYHDAHSGEVLIQRTENEFGRYHHHTTYPAHWGYEALDFSSRRRSIQIDGVPVNSTGQITTSNIANALRAGDELLVSGMTTHLGEPLVTPYNGIYHVGARSATKFIIDQAGRVLPAGTYSIRIVRPAARNQYNIPVYEYTTLLDPTGLGLGSTGNQFIDVKGRTLKEDWQIDEVWHKRQVCTYDTIGKSDPFFRDTLLVALMDRDTFWAKEPGAGMTVHSVVSSRFTVLPSKIWRGSRIDQISFYRISPPVGQYGNQYPVYIAKVGNCYLEIHPSNCDISLKQQRSSGSSGVMAGDGSLDCNYVYTDILYGPGTCAGHGGEGVVLVAGDPIQCYYNAFMVCRNCQYTDTCYALVQDTLINPFAGGLLNRWSTDKEFVHHRNKYSINTLNTTTRTRDDGYIQSFTPHLWTFSSGNLVSSGASNAAWIPVSTQTKVDNRMNAIERLDALDIPHSSLMGYKNNVAKAVVANARLRNIAMECFEDWGYGVDCSDPTCYLDPHFDFYSSANVGMRSDEYAHTGRYSIKVPSGSFARECRLIPNYTESGAKFDNRTSPTEGYRMKNPGKLPKFYPEPDTFVVSTWVRKGAAAATPTLTVRFNNTACCASSGSSVVLSPAGPVIEGWQRIFGTFIVTSSRPCSGSTSSLDFTFATSNGLAYFDDFRVHPLRSSMQSYVYDHTNLRMSATLDENNYATFYEYDDMGNLIRIKRETERGIMTIQEGAKRMKTEQ